MCKRRQTCCIWKLYIIHTISCHLISVGSIVFKFNTNKTASDAMWIPASFYFIFVATNCNIKYVPIFCCWNSLIRISQNRSQVFPIIFVFWITYLLIKIGITNIVHLMNVTYYLNFASKHKFQICQGCASLLRCFS